MPLTKRQYTLIHTMNKQAIITSEQLAKELQISNRTLRNEIKEINTVYPDLIYSIKSKGYELNKQHKDLPLLIHKDHLSVEGNTEYLYIVKRILTEHEMDYYALADELYISESTLDKQIQSVNAIIARRSQSIQIIRQHNRLKLTGSEEEHRQIYTYLMNHEMDQYNFDLTKYTEFFSSCDLRKVKSYVLSFQQSHQLQMRDFEVISLILHIAIMLERIAKGYEIDTILDYIPNKEAEQLAKEFATGCEQEFSIQLSPLELQYLACLFAGKLSDMNTERVQDMNGLVTEITHGLYEHYDLDVRYDTEFQDSLLIHLLGLDSRIRSASFLNNPLIKDIRIHFPLLYDMSVYVAMLVSNKFHIQLIEDEIGYITLHIMSAVERIQKTKHKTIILINPFGNAAESYLNAKLLKIQDPIITIAKSLSLFDLTVIEEEAPDLVISFIPIHEPLPVPIYTLDHFPKESDITKILDLLTKHDIVPSYDVSEFFHEDLFFYNYECSNKEEVLHFLCNACFKQGICKEDYEAYVLAREQIAPTAYGASFALPHPIEKCANTNAIAVCTLKQPILWNNRSVRLIFLFALSNQKSLAFDQLFEQLVSLLDEPQKVKRLLKKPTLSEFLKELEAI